MNPQATWNLEVTESPTFKQNCNENGSRLNNLQKEEVGTTDVQTGMLQFQNGHLAGKKKVRPSEALDIHSGHY